jgi:hypothetical protein
MTRSWLGAVGWTALIVGLSHSPCVCAGDAVAYPAQTYIPFKVMGRVALAAEAACADQGYTVSVTVVDRVGVKRVASWATTRRPCRLAQATARPTPPRTQA